MVIAGKLSQHLCKSCIIRSSTDKTHCKNGTQSYIVVVIVRVFTESVKNIDKRIRCAEETKCQRNRFADDRLAIVHLFKLVRNSKSPIYFLMLRYQMIESSQRHFRADIFSHCDQGDTNCGKCLMQIIFLLLVYMIVAKMEHLLNLQDISSAGIGQHFDQNFSLCSKRVLDCFQSFNGCIRCILSTCILC